MLISAGLNSVLADIAGTT